MAQLTKLGRRMGTVEGALEYVIRRGNSAEVRARAASLGLAPHDVADAIDASGPDGTVTAYLLRGTPSAASARNALEEARAAYTSRVIMRLNR